MQQVLHQPITFMLTTIFHTFAQVDWLIATEAAARQPVRVQILLINFEGNLNFLGVKSEFNRTDWH